MANSYTKMNNKLLNDRDVLRMSLKLGVSKFHIIGCLFGYWEVVNTQGKRVGDSDDLEIEFSAELLDCAIGVEGFSRAMPDRWLIIEGDSTIIAPDYWRHCDQKSKSANANRQSQYRARKRGSNASVTHSNALRNARVTRSNATSSSNNNNNNSKQPLAGKAPPPPKPPKLRKPDPLSAAWAARFYPEGVPDDQVSKFGKELKSLKQMNATHEQVAIRAKNYRREFDATLTPTALVKHWQTCAGNKKRELWKDG